VLVQANVWNPGVEKHATNLTSKPSQRPKGWPTPAPGLTARDFHVFDNDAEQKINFLKELDFDGRWSYPWWLEPDSHGTWGSYDPGPYVTEDATATYLIGYAPPSVQPGECRSVSVVVESHEVDVNRTQYCNPEAPGKAALTTEESQLEALLNSQARRPVKVSIQASSFWSSRVLRLLTEPPSQNGGSAEPGSGYTYVVQVHNSKAPATVHIATEFHWRIEEWSECLKRNPSIHIFGTVYKANGGIATQFKDIISCQNPRVMRSTPLKYALKHGWVSDTARIPTRFDTQVELPPGDYKLRVLVTNGTSVGQAEIPLHVDAAFGEHPLGISDAVLGGVLRDSSSVLRDAATVYPASIIPTPLISKQVQFFPATDNRVPKHTPLSVYFEIYEPALETQTEEVLYSVKITNLKTNSLVMNTGPMSAANWVLPGNAVIPIGLKLNIEKLKPGFYRLEVQGSDSAGRETAWRTANFNIQ
jgi:hypothetical protein